MAGKPKLFVGERFERLIVLSHFFIKDKNDWNINMCVCLCDCGNIKEIRAASLRAGLTRSCGCISDETNGKRIGQRNLDSRQFHPQISTARDIFSWSYSEGNLTFEQFFELSQQRCFYCCVEPFLTRMRYRKNSSNFHKENCAFTYNGLDRVDPDLPHNFDNVVPCCHFCNRTKSNQTQQEFYERITNIHNLAENRKLALDLPSDTEINALLEKYSLLGAGLGKAVFRKLRNRYKDRDCDIKLLIYLSQLPCTYCGAIGVNAIRHKDQKFLYNGFDRVNNSQGHILSNIVPCCIHCNFAKGDRSLSEFLFWAETVYQNLLNKNLITFHS